MASVGNFELPSFGNVELPSWLHLDYSGAFELALALLCVVYAVVFWRGYRANTRLAEAFRGAFVEACSVEFTRVGLKKADGGEATLLRDGATRFLSYATGRANCSGLTAVLELAPRMDLFARLKGLWAPVRPDALSLLAPVERMPPVCVWLAARRRWHKVKDAFGDAELLRRVELLTKEVRLAKRVQAALGAPPTRWIGLAEHEDVFEAVLSERMTRLLKPVGESIQEVYFSECGCAWDIYGREVQNGVVRVEMDLAQGVDMEQAVSALVRLALGLVDWSARMRIGLRGSKKCEEVRAIVKSKEHEEKMRVRREELAERRVQEERERRENESKMSRKQQEKLERRRRKAKQREGTIRIAKRL